MPNICNNNFIISGSKVHLDIIIVILNSLNADQKIFNALVGKPKDSNEEAMTAYYGTKWDVPKSQLQYSFDPAFGIIANMETAWEPATGFYEKLSEKYAVNINVEFDSINDDVKGKLVYENGIVTERKDYRYMEGIYYLDTSNDKADFWYEVEIRTDDEYRDNYNTADEVMENELSFLTEREKMRFNKLF